MVTATTPAKKPEIDWKKYKMSGLSVTQLDDMMKFTMNSGTTGWFAVIIMGIKIIIISKYLHARKELLENEIFIAKQEFEQINHETDRDEVNT